MAESLADQVLRKIGEARELYHRLILIVGLVGSGKTSALQEVSASTRPAASLAAQAGRWIMTLSENRLYDQIRFYEIRDMLAERIGEPRMLAECTGRVL